MRSNFPTAIGVVMVVCATWPSAAEEPQMFYAASNTETSPVIDGHLNDRCWQDVERTRPMTCLGGATAPVATTAMARWDDKNLYFALICAEPQMAAIRQKMAEGRLRPFDESVEIYIDAAHDHFSFLQFRVDIIGRRDTYEGPTRDKSLDQRWSSAVARDQDRWTAEVAIPWKLLGKGRPDATTVCGLNLYRNRSVGSEVEYACWTDTKGGFSSADHFGNLVFFPYPVFLRSYFSAAFRSSYDEMGQLNRRIRSGAAVSETQLAAITTENEHFLQSLESTAIACGRDAAAPYARGLEQQRKLALLQDEAILQAVRGLASASEKEL